MSWSIDAELLKAILSSSFNTSSFIIPISFSLFLAASLSFLFSRNDTQPSVTFIGASSRRDPRKQQRSIATLRVVWDTRYIRERRRRQSRRRRLTCAISTKLYGSGGVRGRASTRQKQPQWPTRNTSIPSRLTLGLTYRQRNIWRSNIFPCPLGWWHFPATRSPSPLNSFPIDR